LGHITVLAGEKRGKCFVFGRGCSHGFGQKDESADKKAIKQYPSFNLQQKVYHFTVY
jgi:hypothetical protein